jgi:hypothetical protein
MANKRIELEQYKHYFDLQQEEPNRKRWRKGIEIAFIVAAVLAVAMFVLGMMSSTLAQNARNVLEKPPAKQSPTQQNTVPGVTPGGTNGTQTPYSPTQQQGIPITPSNQQQSPGGKAPSAPIAERASFKMPFGADDGALIAQAQESQSVPFNMEQTTPDAGASTSPTQQPGQKKSAKSEGPGEQTEGVGSLANLANGVSGRGFQLYLLVVLIALLIILYLPVRKARLEGKSK